MQDIVSKTQTIQPPYFSILYPRLMRELSTRSWKKSSTVPFYLLQAQYMHSWFWRWCCYPKDCAGWSSWLRRWACSSYWQGCERCQSWWCSGLRGCIYSRQRHLFAQTSTRSKAGRGSASVGFLERLWYICSSGSCSSETWPDWRLQGIAAADNSRWWYQTKGVSEWSAVWL